MNMKEFKKYIKSIGFVEVINRIDVYICDSIEVDVWVDGYYIMHNRYEFSNILPFKRLERSKKLKSILKRL